MAVEWWPDTWLFTNMRYWGQPGAIRNTVHHSVDVSLLSMTMILYNMQLYSKGMWPSPPTVVMMLCNFDMTSQMNGLILAGIALDYIFVFPLAVCLWDYWLYLALHSVCILRFTIHSVLLTSWVFVNMFSTWVATGFGSCGYFIKKDQIL